MKWMLSSKINRSKKIALGVIASHLFLVALAGIAPSIDLPHSPATPIQVHTHIEQAPIYAAVKPRKAKVKNRPNQKKIDQLFAGIERAQSMRHSPSTFEPIAPFQEVELSTPHSKQTSTTTMLATLQNLIELPKKGELHLTFSIDDKGHLTDVKVLSSEEAENEAYIYSLLNGLRLPPKVIDDINSQGPFHMILHGVH